MESPDKSVQHGKPAKEYSDAVLAEITKQRGRLARGAIVGMSDYYLDLHLNDLPVSNVGVMHISQASDHFIPTLQGRFAIGQELDVVVLFLRRADLRWEVSLSAVGLQERWNATYPIGSAITGEVKRFGDYGCLVYIRPGFLGRIAPDGADLLRRAGRLLLGSQVHCMVGGWDERRPGALLVLTDSFQATGVVNEHRFEVNDKGTRAELYLLVDCGSSGKFLCEARRLARVLSRFPIGATVTVRFRQYNKMLFDRRTKREKDKFHILFSHLRSDEQPGELELTKEQSLVDSQLPQMGTLLDLVITSVTDRYVIGMVADYVNGFLHHSQIVRDTVARYHQEVWK